MKYYLAKSEPSVYSIDHLERDRKTVWDGVTNPQAVKAIRAMKPGDRVFLYHSGGASAVVIGGFLDMPSAATTLTGALLCFGLRLGGIYRGWHLPKARPSTSANADRGPDPK